MKKLSVAAKSYELLTLAAPYLVMSAAVIVPLKKDFPVPEPVDR
jgi:hypothetical protein